VRLRKDTERTAKKKGKEYRVIINEAPQEAERAKQYDVAEATRGKCDSVFSFPMRQD
jgi:hypothetical protein